MNFLAGDCCNPPLFLCIIKEKTKERVILLFAKFRALFGAQDMTEGKPLKCLLKFSVPLLIGNLAQLLYTTVDSIVVGRFVGDAALSAIGITSPILNLFLVLFMSVGSGVTVMVSQYFGAREYKKLEDAIGNAITLIIATAIVLTIVGTLSVNGLLRMMRTPVESFDMSHAYLFICFLGLFGTGLYNVMSGILRGMGESVFPLLVLLGTTLLNTALDIWFVAGLKMGIAGAALATIIGQTLSSIVCLLKVIYTRKYITLRTSNLRLKKEVVGTICRLGIPNGISQAVMWGAVLAVQRLNNQMGYLVAAAITATIRVDSFAVIPAQTFNMSASTFTGQNIGAGRMDRVKKGCYTTFLMCLTTSVIMIILMLSFGRWMIGLFSTTEELIDMGYRFIKVMIPGYILMAIGQSFGGVIRGAGDSMGPMWISLATQVVVRIPAAYLIAYLTRTEAHPAGDPATSFIAMVISMTCSAAATIIYFNKGKWKNKAIAGRKAPAEAET